MFSLMPWRKEREDSGRLASRIEHPLGLFRTGLDELVDRVVGNWPGLFEDGWMAGLEVEETDDKVMVRIDAPGFEASDFDIQVGDDTLRIEAERKTEEVGKDVRIERRLRRSVNLPSRVNPDKVEAKYRHGVLELTLVRMEPARRRKVEVKAE